jgi:hypothetical protein
MKATQRNKLLKMTEQSGWHVRSIEGKEQLWSGTEWFIAELWEIESVWSPRGFRAFITFVVDPQSNFAEEHRWPSVWMVIASLQRPISWGGGAGEVGLVLNRGWQARLPEFLNGLNALRSGAITG